MPRRTTMQVPVATPEQEAQAEACDFYLLAAKVMLLAWPPLTLIPLAMHYDMISVEKGTPLLFGYIGAVFYRLTRPEPEPLDPRPPIAILARRPR